MVTLPRSPLNIRLIIFQILVLTLSPIWILKLTHYFTHPLPFLFDSPSLIPQSQTQTINYFDDIDFTQTLINISTFGLFFIQHILMARLNFKIQCHKIWTNFHIYERLIYNLVSSILIMLLLDFQSPQNYVLFTLPFWICIPFILVGFFFMIDSNLQMQSSLLLPYKFTQLFNTKQIVIKPNQYTKIEDTGITIKGSYSIIRHPMQSGCILLFTFGSNIFTFEKVFMLLFLYIFIYVGVKMEEQRLLIKYKQYKDYMNSIRFRFFPYVF